MQLIMEKVDMLTDEQEEKMMAQFGATWETLKRDTATLREWLEKQPHLPKLTAADDGWLGRYLLACKNSMERCKHRLEFFFTAQARWPDLFAAPSTEKGLELSKYIWGAPMPKLLPNGHRLCIYKFTKLGSEMPEKVDWTNIFMLSLAFLQLQLCSLKQPLTLEIIVDVQYYNFALNNAFIGHLAEFHRFVQCLLGAFPLHVYRIHVMNAPSLAITALNKLIRPFLQEKVNNRVMTHESIESLAKAIPHYCLPKDFGGSLEGNVEEYTQRFAEYSIALRPWFEARQYMKADLSAKPNHALNSEFGLDGSFRKLAVD